MSDRDRRALAILGVALTLAAAIYFWPVGTATEVVSAEIDSPEAAELRLQKLRQVIATIPAKRKLAEQVQAQLAAREKGMILADTAAQAQAQLMQTVTRLARNQQIDVAQRDLGVIQPLGKDYGSAAVAVSFACQIEQLVNLLADLAAQPDLIATHELQARAGDAKKKIVAVRLTVTGIMPKKLVPERKGPMAF
ncbi:MAG: hypothetical protein FJW39_03315 [Acidobacteria bacterium]|nr:hypothetical protein [Acidobacteriota bacterium]